MLASIHEFKHARMIGFFNVVVKGKPPPTPIHICATISNHSLTPTSKNVISLYFENIHLLANFPSILSNIQKTQIKGNEGI
jgi:hypothetical protein